MLRQRKQQFDYTIIPADKWVQRPMHLIETIDKLKETRKSVIAPVGLVPTMGYLHEGHLSLVRQARNENATLIVSIFVNPIQFDPSEDLVNYPRDVEHDLSSLENIGADLVFIPTEEEMYPPGFDTSVEVGSLSRKLEGKDRPIHFRGVTTVVARLFGIVRPDRAYFGQKDNQQALILQRMNADLELGIDLVVMPTVREFDGLAMSSRNHYLNSMERSSATVLYRSLSLAKELWDNGETQSERIRVKMRQLIELEPKAFVHYISIADASTLDELIYIDRRAIVSLAVTVGKTRLIDNIVLETA